MRWAGLALTAVLAVSSGAVAVADRPVSVLVNGKPLRSDVPPRIVDGRTLAPVRAVAEALGARVGWDADAGTVSVTTPGLAWQAPLTSPSGGSTQLDVPCTISDWEGFCVIDTGNSLGGGIPPEKAPAAHVTLGGAVQFFTANGKASENVAIAAVSVGGSPTLLERIVVDANAPPVPIIGLQFLMDACNGRLTFDFGDRLLTCTR